MRRMEVEEQARMEMPSEKRWILFSFQIAQLGEWQEKFPS